MRRLVTGIAISACAFALAYLLPPGVSLAYAQGDAAFEKGLLWRIEKAGTPSSYLFGTVHLADKRVTTLPEVVRNEFMTAQSFTLEVSLDQSNAATLAARMMYLDGRDLAAVAGETLYRKLVGLTADLGMPSEMTRRFKPWAMVLLLQMPQQESANVLDFMLQRMAIEQGKALYYLETVDEQVAAFDDMAEQEQVALLRHAVETHHEATAQREKIVQAYLQRDLGLMWRIGESDVVKRPDLRPLKEVFDQRLLYDRNIRMAERMQPQLQAGGAFIAVGALHLYGERGLLSLLSRNGYGVKRVY